MITSVLRLNLAPFLPFPSSEAHISTLSCFEVKESRKKFVACMVLNVTLGRWLAAPPRYLMTELVWYIWMAAYNASAP